jgi:O-succinylbenzoic acid--CoA ligase
MRDWLADRAAVTPEALALVDTDTETRWSYGGLDAAVEETAGRLVALGAAPGEQVGMLLSTRLRSVCLLHAAQRLGLQLVPLNTRLTDGELAAQLEELDPTMLVCSSDTERTTRRAAESTAASARLPIASIDDPESTTVKSFGEVEPAAVEPADWAITDPQLIVFTSGTTGRPKPVVLTMGNLLSSAVASGFRLGVDDADRWLVTLAPYHVGGLAPIFRSTLYGTSVVLRSSFDPGGAADDIDRYDVTMVSLVPTMLSKMLDRRGTLSDSLRVVLLGGAPAPASLIERCRNYSVPVHPTYGMTEAASQIATARPVTAFKRPRTVGRPLLWTDLTIVDEAGEPVDAGESGEIVVDGPTVTPGYYEQPERTEAAFCRYGLRTGDVGSQTDDGLLVVHNRLDDRIITGGENVDPGEVCSTLRAHPAVADAAVVGLSDDTWGQRVGALVVSTGGKIPLSDIETHCRERLAGYKRPRTVAVVDALPRTTSGTVDRPAVRERLQSIGVDLDDRNGADGDP